MPAIVFSAKDPAGCNIFERLCESWPVRQIDQIGPMAAWEGPKGTKIVRVDCEIVRPDFLEQWLKPDLWVFASKHRSEAKRPTLTVHTCGVFSQDVSVGGRPRQLAVAPAGAMKAALQHLAEHAVPGYEVSLEVTHHGPTNLAAPMMFVEVGSSEAQWADRKAAAVAASAVVAVCESYRPAKEATIGFGGGHYCPTFTKRELATETAYSHIAAKYVCELLDAELVHQMVTRSHERVAHAAIDWKSFNATERTRITDLCEKAGLEWAKA